MKNRDGRVTLLPKQIRRLAKLEAENPGAIAIFQDGSVLHIDTGIIKLCIDANGDDIRPENQEPLC